MKALIKSDNKITLKNITEAELLKGYVKIKVMYIGLCRTDLLVANGTIKTNKDLVLGHEFSGFIVESKSKKFNVGELVSVNPYYQNEGFMGLDFNGCIQEYINVIDKQVIKMDNIDPKVAAYIEPLSASMSVLNILKNKNKLIGVYGNNRIAELTYIILKNSQYNVKWIKDFTDEKAEYDYIIETDINNEIFKEMIAILKYKGTLILKSRKNNSINILPNELIKKEINIKTAKYYNFNKAKLWLEKNFKLIEHLLGEDFSINNWDLAFKTAEKSEIKKIFIRI